MPTPHVKRSLSLTVLRHVVYVSWSFLFLYPILSTPVVADDYAGPFYQFASGGSSLTSSLKYGFDAAHGGVNFRLLGMPAGSFVHFAYVWAAGELGVPIVVSYAITKFVVLLTCSYLLAHLSRLVLSLIGLQVQFESAAFVAGAVFFGTLQIHGNWSNDPVVSYPLAGYGSVIFILGLFSLAIRFSTSRDNRARLSFWLTLVSCLSVIYYEMAFSAILAMSLILLFSFVRGIRSMTSPRQLVSWVLLHSAPVVIPVVTVTLGRLQLATASTSYGGTTVSLGGRSVRTFLISFLGSIPTSAWKLAMDFEPNVTRPVLWVMPVFVIVMIAAVVASFTKTVAERARNQDLGLASVTVLALIVGWCAAVAMQSITLKVQDETPRLGYVYTHYAVGSAVVALLCSVGVLVVLSRARNIISRLVPLLAVVLILTVQWNINWRLTDRMNSTLIPNRSLLDAFSSQPDIPIRCRALNDWTNGPWPDYYELGMINGLQKAYRKFHNEDFCPNFVRPNP